MSVPRLEQSGHQPPTPSLDQIASRSQVQVEDSQLTSDLSSLPPSSSSPNKMGQSSVKPVAPVVEREEVGNSFINSNHATQVKQPVQPTPATQEPKVHRRKPSKADSNHPRKSFVSLPHEFGTFRVPSDVFPSRFPSTSTIIISSELILLPS